LLFAIDAMTERWLTLLTDASFITYFAAFFDYSFRRHAAFTFAMPHYFDIFAFDISLAAFIFIIALIILLLSDIVIIDDTPLSHFRLLMPLLMAPFITFDIFIFRLFDYAMMPIRPLRLFSLFHCR
jgi:hypothetical protein